MTDGPVPLPGGTERGIIDRLTIAKFRFMNLRGSGLIAGQLWAAYVAGVGEQTRPLRAVLPQAAITQLLYTDGYRNLLAFGPAARLVIDPSQLHLDLTAAALTSLVQNEIDDACQRLTDLADAVRHSRSRLTDQGTELFVVPDTNVLVSRPGRPDTETLVTLPWLTLLDPAITVDPPALVRVQLPLLVLDELDNLKDSARDPHVRRRARHVLRDLNRLLAGKSQTAPIGLKTRGPGEPATFLELIFDNPGHERLPRADDELVAVARQLHALRGEPVHLITGDFHLATRARRHENRARDDSELLVHLLTHNLEEPPSTP